MYKNIWASLLACFIIFTATACGTRNNPAEPSMNSSGSSSPASNSSTAGEDTAVEDSTGKSAGEENAAVADTLTIAITNDENSLTPFTYISSTGLTVNRLIYDTLFTTDLENEIIPWMVADDYKIENDFKSYTFTLLEGQKFHDGSPVTIQDIEFSFTYPKDQNISTPRKICNQIERFEILDDKTMTIHLVSPDINFIRSGLAYMRIISRSQYENQPDGLQVNDTMGSGMYRLAEYKTGQYYKLEAVNDYFKGTPTVKNINMPIITDDTVIQQSLLSGELAATTSTIGVEMLDTFSNTKDLDIFASEGYRVMLMNINNGREPMDSKEFRDALTYGINVSGIMESLYGDYATVGTRGVLRPDYPYSLPGTDYVYDVAKANSILDGAGFDKKDTNGIRLAPNGDTCSFEILVYSTNTVHIRAAELIAEQLKDIGLNLTVKAMEMDTVDAFVWPDFDVSKGRDYDFAMWGWGTSIGMNSDFIVSLFSSDNGLGTANVCGYINPDFDEKVTTDFKAVQTTEELNTVLRELQSIVSEDPGLICFGYPDSLQAANTTQYSGWKAGKGTNVINVFSFLSN